MATVEHNPDGSIKRIVLGIEDSAVIDVLLDVEARNTEREARALTRADKLNGALPEDECL